MVGNNNNNNNNFFSDVYHPCRSSYLSLDDKTHLGQWDESWKDSTI